MQELPVVIFLWASFNPTLHLYYTNKYNTENLLTTFYTSVEKNKKSYYERLHVAWKYAKVQVA